MINQRYEYKFVRVGEGFMSVRKQGQLTYKDEINKYAQDGWRLVQIFAPGIGVYGASKYYELILEREK